MYNKKEKQVASGQNKFNLLCVKNLTTHTTQFKSLIRLKQEITHRFLHRKVRKLVQNQ